jgi:uncharacterized delta-60 repeat protein
MISDYDFLVARYRSNGVLDTTFGASGTNVVTISAQEDRAWGVVLLSDGSMVASGYSDSTSGKFATVKLNSDGSTNTAFGSAGKILTTIGANARAIGVLVDSLERLIVGGWVLNSQFALARYYP